MSKSHCNNSKAFLLFYLGLLSAFGPFVMDMYLPSLPSMTGYFHTSASAVQWGLTSCMAGLAIGQLVFGMLSDAYGRRRPLLVALCLFLLSTAGCLYAGTIRQFVVFRFVQGLAGAGGVVLSRSVAADRYSARELAAVLAIVGSINGVATVAAPVAGGLLDAVAGWRGIFWFLFALGLLLVGATCRFRETLSPSCRKPWCIQEVRTGFLSVLRNRAYVSNVLQYGLSMALLFTYISSAPFIMQRHFHLSPLTFGLFFGVNALAMVGATGFSARFAHMARALHVASRGQFLFGLALCVALAVGCPFWVYELLVFGLLAAVGLGFTASNALAMDSERGSAGVASALLGAAGFVGGVVVTPLVGLGDILMTTGLLLVALSMASWILLRRAARSWAFPTVVGH